MNEKEAGIIAALAVLFEDNLIIAGGYYRDLDNGRPFGEQAMDTLVDKEGYVCLARMHGGRLMWIVV